MWVVRVQENASQRDSLFGKGAGPAGPRRLGKYEMDKPLCDSERLCCEFLPGHGGHRLGGIPQDRLVLRLEGNAP